MNSIRSDIFPKVLTEFLEIAIHNVIRVRNLYPETVFVKRHKYGVAVEQCIHPRIVDYINNCMKAIYQFVRDKQLKRIVVCFNNSGNEVIERVTFNVINTEDLGDEDPYLIKIESQFRSFCIKIKNMISLLKPLPEDVTFSIQIFTTKNAGIAYTQSPENEDFPWIEVNSSYRDLETFPNSRLPIELISNEFLDMTIYFESLK